MASEMTNLRGGYWSDSIWLASTVDWCEQNYTVSYYIAEFFNSFSSLAMCLVGFAGIWAHRNVLELRFLLAYFWIMTVGIGSFAFHATLLFVNQMWDEVPMLWAVLTLAYGLIENGNVKKKYPILPWVLTAWGVVITSLVCFTHGNLQFALFHMSFGSLEWFCMYRVYKLYKAQQDPVMKSYYLHGLKVFGAAVISWILDLKLCWFFDDYLPNTLGIPNPQLHSWWHVLVSYSLLHLISLVAYEREVVRGNNPVFHLGFIPRVVSQKKES